MLFLSPYPTTHTLSLSLDVSTLPLLSFLPTTHTLSPSFLFPLPHYTLSLSFRSTRLHPPTSPLSPATPSIPLLTGYVSEAEDIYEVTDTDNQFRLKCGVLGGEPYQLVYWYRNGLPIQEEGDSYDLVGDSRELDGSVYQCFVVTSTGMINQTTWRVFNISKYVRT